MIAHGSNHRRMPMAKGDCFDPLACGLITRDNAGDDGRIAQYASRQKTDVILIIPCPALLTLVPGYIRPILPLPGQLLAHTN